MVEEELEEVFGFFIFISNDTTGETVIHIQSLFTCDGMNTNKRMLYSQLFIWLIRAEILKRFLADCANLIFYGISANGTIALSRVLGLINGGV